MRPGAGKSAVRPVSVIRFKYNYEPEDARVINGESIWSIVMLDSNLNCNISNIECSHVSGTASRNTKRQVEQPLRSI